jgi:D-xylose transport system substrate-binding protein
VIGSTRDPAGWVGVAAAEELRRRLEVPVVVDNDANLGALAEVRHGAGRGASDLVYVKVASGIGAGLILDGRLYRGGAGWPASSATSWSNRRAPSAAAATAAASRPTRPPGAAEVLRRSHGDASPSPRCSRSPRRRSRLPPRDRRRRPQRRPGRGFVFNVLNPQRLVVGGDSRRGGDLLLDGVRSPCARGAARGRRRPPAWWRAARRARQVLGRSRWRSRGGAALDLPQRSAKPFPEGEQHEEGGAVWLIALVFAMGFVVAACGDDDDSSGAEAARAASRATRRRRPARSPSCCRTRSRRCAGRRSTGRSCRRRSTTAGVESTIQNAEGDKSTQQQQAEQAITNGAKVILLVNLDSGSGAAIAANAKSQGVKVIDYDRLTLDTTRRTTTSRSTTRGRQAAGGRGLVNCSATSRARVAVLNARHRQQRHAVQEGLRRVIDAKFDAGDWRESRRSVVPDWDNQKALTIFEQMPAEEQQQGRRRARGQRRPRPTRRSRDQAAQAAADPRDRPGRRRCRAVQNIVNGDQCMTVYKAVKKEADAAADLAIALAKGEKPTPRRPRQLYGTHDVPSRLESRSRHQGQHQGVPRRAGLPEEGGHLRRQAGLEVHEAGL